MLSHVLISELEKDINKLTEFRNKLIDDNIALGYSDYMYTLSGFMGKVEAIIQLSKEEKI